MLVLYSGNMYIITLYSVFIFILWTFFIILTNKNMKWKVVFRITSFGLSFVSICTLIYLTVWGRETSDNHQFVFINDMNDEFYRELFFNTLLYCPLGLSLSILIGPWAILIGFVLSLTIETWQYLNGAGLAQGTDVIMNTLGTVLGVLPYWLSKNKRIIVWETQLSFWLKQLMVRFFRFVRNWGNH